jgi:hypothetical protein
MRDDIRQMIIFRRFRAHKFAPRRRVEKQIATVMVVPVERAASLTSINFRLRYKRASRLRILRFS